MGKFHKTPFCSYLPFASTWPEITTSVHREPWWNTLKRCKTVFLLGINRFERCSFDLPYFSVVWLYVITLKLEFISVTNDSQIHILHRLSLKLSNHLFLKLFPTERKVSGSGGKVNIRCIIIEWNNIKYYKSHLTDDDLSRSAGLCNLLQYYFKKELQ